MFAHAVAECPNECCGILIGTRGEDFADVAEVHRVANVWPGERTHRFELDARTHVRLQREARERGLEIIGFYHSHPVGSATPSAFDAELAWPGASYVIVSLRDDQPGEVKSWVVDESAGRLLPEHVIVVDDRTES